MAIWRCGSTPRLCGLVLAVVIASPASAFSPEILNSVVSVLPEWPGYPRGRAPAGRYGEAPEGTAIAVRPDGYLATNLHVVARARKITVRDHAGRLIPAEIVGRDAATDIAVLKIARDLPVPPIGPEPELADRVCVVGNPFGLGLSVTCGVVSALHRSGMGFNAIEDFIQTDATVNPGASGGALVDAKGRLIGMISAIFTKGTDADIGVNFAASIALVRRVADDLIRHGRVIRVSAGLRVRDLTDAERRTLSGVRVVAVPPGGGAARAGLRPGDIVTAIGTRDIFKTSDLYSVIYLHRPADQLEVHFARENKSRIVTFELDGRRP
jgi:S1-C subfamily serine protease